MAQQSGPCSVRGVGKATALAAALTVGSFAAKADVVTWNPAGALPPLAGTQFSFDQLKVEDFGRIVIGGSGTNFTFNEGGILNVTQAHLFGHLPAATYTPGRLGTTYQLYMTFTASGTTTAPDFTTPTISTATGQFT